jgi:hypothetical protein
MAFLVIYTKPPPSASLLEEIIRDPLQRPNGPIQRGQNPTPPVVREMGLQIEPVDGRWGSE